MVNPAKGQQIPLGPGGGGGASVATVAQGSSILNLEMPDVNWTGTTGFTGTSQNIKIRPGNANSGWCSRLV